MVLKVSEGRSLSIDTSGISLGDMLVVKMDQGRPIRLMPVGNGYERCWWYTAASRLSDDQAEIDRLVRRHKSYHKRPKKDGSIRVEVRHIELDQSLALDVIISWDSDPYQKGVRETIGHFVSCGGRVRNVTASRYC